MILAPGGTDAPSMLLVKLVGLTSLLPPPHPPDILCSRSPRPKYNASTINHLVVVLSLSIK